MNVASDMALLQNVDDFKLHYRVTRQTFEVILCEVAADLLQIYCTKTLEEHHL